MKCVRNQDTGLIIRTTDARAADLVSVANWKYVPKKDWKETGRVVVKSHSDFCNTMEDVAAKNLVKLVKELNIETLSRISKMA